MARYRISDTADCIGLALDTSLIQLAGDGGTSLENNFDYDFHDELLIIDVYITPNWELEPGRHLAPILLLSV